MILKEDINNKEIIICVGVQLDLDVQQVDDNQVGARNCVSKMRPKIRSEIEVGYRYRRISLYDLDTEGRTRTESFGYRRTHKNRIFWIQKDGQEPNLLDTEGQLMNYITHCSIFSRIRKKKNII